jgi:drug/metabolite transporter (DMT)-like permease
MTVLLDRFRVDLLLLLVAASWGSTYLVAKELVTPGSVVALLALRMLLAAAVMAAIVTARRNRVTAAELRVGMILGVLLAAVFAFETFGIAHTSATNAGLIISLTIVFTPILESVTSGRRLPGRFFLAALVAVAGVALLAGNGALRPPSLGDLLVLVAAIVRAVHVTSMHRLSAIKLSAIKPSAIRPSAVKRSAVRRGAGALSAVKPMDSLHLTTVQLATCAALFTVTSLFYGDPLPQYLAQLNPRSGLLFLYLVLVCTVFAFFVQTWAVRRTSPSRVSLLLGTEPIWAAIIGIAVARDSVGPAGYFGIALILAGTAWGRAVEQQHRLAASPPSTTHQPPLAALDRTLS